jgi:hypothetical protein
LRPRRPSGNKTAKIAAAVISANTNHSVIGRVPEGAVHLRIIVPLYTTPPNAGN